MSTSKVLMLMVVCWLLGYALAHIQQRRRVRCLKQTLNAMYGKFGVSAEPAMTPAEEHFMSNLRRFSTMTEEQATRVMSELTPEQKVVITRWYHEDLNKRGLR